MHCSIWHGDEGVELFSPRVARAAGKVTAGAG